MSTPQGAMVRLEKTLESNSSIENTKLFQQTRQRLRSHRQQECIGGVEHSEACMARRTLHAGLGSAAEEHSTATCQPLTESSLRGEASAPLERASRARRGTRELLYDMVNSMASREWWPSPSDPMHERAPSERAVANALQQQSPSHTPSKLRLMSFNNDQTSVATGFGRRSSRVVPEPETETEMLPPPRPSSDTPAASPLTQRPASLQLPPGVLPSQPPERRKQRRRSRMSKECAVGLAPPQLTTLASWGCLSSSLAAPRYATHSGPLSCAAYESSRKEAAVRPGGPANVVDAVALRPTGRAERCS